MRRAALLVVACAAALAAGAGQAAAPTVHPQIWPAAHDPVGLDPVVERKIDALLARMTVAEKVGQVIQPELKSITPQDVATYRIGSVENGGGSVPGGDKHASVRTWVETVSSYWDYSVRPAPGRPRIPMMWGSDAVHGHNNVFGATLFPHNIGLGAAHDPALIRRIGAATADEVRATGMDWSFAPTLAVAQDDRWGRTYESYSERPQIVAEYAAAMVEGLEGSGPTFLNADHVIATAKHFLGDGGTAGGRDQGDARVPEATLRDIHGAGYPAAIDAGVQAVMASFSSWNGEKMHANEGLLTEVLKKRMGFDGLVIGDWNAHGQVPGCSNSDCPAAFNAGIDVFNAPQDWKALDGNMIREVRDGTIPMARLDDAVRRVLRVKFRAHVFEEPRPSARPHAGQALGSPAHRAVARQAVRESLVLLKNDGVLPIRPGQHVVIAGDGADNIAKQTGGWTLSWQGADNTNADLPGATSIGAGLKQAIDAIGGGATIDPDFSKDYRSRPNLAVVIFGEDPYAEFQGDQPDVRLRKHDAESLALINKFKRQHIPVVAVLLSGRPLYLNPQINAADAFVAAWLPGSEGEGLADVLVAGKDGKPRHDFRGRLSFSWPKRPDQTPLNFGQPGYDPQFAYGYGLSYAHPQHVGRLPEVAAAAGAGEPGVYFDAGRGWNGFALKASDGLAVRDEDRRRQQDARGLHWPGPAPAWFELAAQKPVDISREANGAMLLSLEVKVNAPPTAPVALFLGKGRLPIEDLLRSAPVGQWTTLAAPLSCFGAAGADLTAINRIGIETAGALDLSLSGVRLTETQPGASCPRSSGWGKSAGSGA